jgi:hypothetical protein
VRDAEGHAKSPEEQIRQVKEELILCHLVAFGASVWLLLTASTTAAAAA